MMGKQVRQEALFTVGVNLEKRVREDHPLRHIHRAVDDAFGVITARQTTPGDVKGNGEMMSLIAAIQNIRL